LIYWIFILCSLAVNLFLAPAAILQAEELVSRGPIVYSQPDANISPSKHFSCKVIPIDKDCVSESLELDSFVYETTPNYAHSPNYGRYNGALSGWTASYTNFELEQNAEIEGDPAKVDLSRVTKPVKVKVAILGDWLPPSVILDESNVKISPIGLAGRAFKDVVVDGVEKTIEFIVTEPANLSIEINGYPNVPEITDHHSMCVFANPPLIGEFTPPPEEGGENVIYIEPGEGPLPSASSGETLYFKPGIHKIPENSPIVAGVNYYIPGGAYVQGTFRGRHKHNTKFWGYGIISGKDIPSVRASGYPPKLLENWGGGLKNFTLQGITFEDAPHHTVNARGGTRESPLRFINYKTINWKPSTDAHNSGGFVLVDGCFFRCQDDDIYVAANRKGAVIRRTTFWNDANACAFLFTSSSGGGNVAVEDCDVIRNHSYILNGKLSNVFNIRKVADNQTIDNVHFKNIRIEDYRKLLFRLNLDDLAHATPFGVVLRNISFKNFTVYNHHDFYDWNEWNNGVVKKHHDKTSMLHGSPERNCQLFNILFENVTFEGRDADYSDFDIKNADVVVQRSTGESLPVSWLNQEIKKFFEQGEAGRACYMPPNGVTLYPDRNTKGTFTLSGSGSGIQDASDHFHTAYKRIDMENGNCAVVAKVCSRTTQRTQAGLMLRNSLKPDSTHVSLLFGPGDYLRFYQRPAKGEPSLQIVKQAVSADSIYLKIIRESDIYTAQYSLSGKENDWHTLGSTMLPGMNARRLYFCLTHCSNDTSTLSSSDFSEVRTTPKMMEY
jgi:hypothetical protein